jgi:hypothetical protein
MSVHEPGDTMVEALRRANPVPVGQGESRRALPSAHALFADIIAEPPARRATRARTRTVAIIIAIVLLVLAALAFVALRKDSPTQPTSVACYSSADLNARRIVVVLSGDAVQTCEAMWSNGDFADLGVKERPTGSFDVCVLPTGVAAVFPGESGSVCSRLGLPESSGGDKNIPGFAKETDGRLNDVCMGYDQAEQIVKGELKKWRLEGWTITRGDRPFNADYPCASIAVDAPARQVVIASYPNVEPPAP